MRWYNRWNMWGRKIGKEREKDKVFLFRYVRMKVSIEYRLWAKWSHLLNRKFFSKKKKKQVKKKNIIHETCRDFGTRRYHCSHYKRRVCRTVSFGQHSGMQTDQRRFFQVDEVQDNWTGPEDPTFMVEKECRQADFVRKQFRVTCSFGRHIIGSTLPH